MDTKNRQSTKGTPREYTEVKTPEMLLTASRRISLIVIHCSATRAEDSYSPEQLIADHKARGFDTAGYHYYITRDGKLYALRPVDMVGAHARGFNTVSVGVCYEGGLDKSYNASDTRTAPQRQMLAQLIYELQKRYPDAVVVGHRDLSPDRNGDGVITRDEWLKECPCFDAYVYR